MRTKGQKSPPADGAKPETFPTRKPNRWLRVIIPAAIIAIVAMLLLPGIRHCKRALVESGYGAEQNSANEYAIDVSMVQLLATPERYDGELVRVVGVGNIEFEGNFLALNKEDHRYFTGSSVWLELGERAIPYSEAVEYNGRYVIVEGFFDKDNGGHLDMFRGSLKDVSRYELWE